MDENPYQAPAEGRPSGQTSSVWAKAIASLLFFVSVLAAALSLFAFGLAVGEIITARNAGAVRLYSIWAAVLLVNAAAWAATAWAIRAKRTKLMIAAFLAVVLGFVLGFLG
jgi:hypothetical protein